MTRKLPVTLVICILASTTSVLLAQIESTLPRKSAQPREAIQPTTTTAPLLKSRPPLDRPPRLTDGATDENGNELESRDDGTTGPTEVLTNRTRTSSVRTRDPDLIMATWIALADHEEIALAQLAADRSPNADIREYASRMIVDHQTRLARLRPFAPEAIRHDYLNMVALSNAPRAARTDETEEVIVRKRTTATDKGAEVGPVIDRLADGKPPEVDPVPSPTRAAEIRPRLGAETDTETRVTVPARREFNAVKVEREVAAQCLASTKALLIAKTGKEFDEWFLAQQVGAHKSLRDKLIVYQRYVSSDLAKVFAENEAAAADHLTQATQLLDQVTNPKAKETISTK